MMQIYVVHIKGSDYSEVWSTRVAALFRKRQLSIDGSEVHIYETTLKEEARLERHPEFQLYKEAIAESRYVGVTTGYSTPIVEET